MIEFWIVPGKLPVKIGETGGDEGQQDPNSASEPGSTVTPTGDDEDPYGYLNGQDSPFYQPPGEGSQTDAGRDY